MADSMEIVSCIRGYHVYQTIWQAALGETFHCVQETSDSKVRYAVSVVKDGQVIGHLPKKFSKLFLRRGGRIQCQVTGSRCHSSDLPQGGLEIPYRILFCGTSELIRKLRE